jgi:hypothetical protein
MTTPIGAALLPSLAGWQVLAKTGDAEKTRFAKQAEIARDIDYFKANIGKVTSPADLVKDRRLLAVTLEAFGLGSDVNAQARVRKVLEQGTTDPKALANRMVDPRYKQMSEFFRFDLGGDVKLKDPKVVEDLIGRYKTQKFESAVGDTNPTLRNAMYFQRKMSTVNNWYEVLADKALFAVVKTTLGLPDAFSKIDVDRQVSILESKAKLATLKQPEQIEKYAKRYIGIASATDGGTGGFSPAVQLLSSNTGYSSSSYGLSSGTLSSLLGVQGLR